MTELPKVPPVVNNFPDDDIFRLRLFVTGATPNSTRAISNIKEFCETYLKNRYELEIVDVYQQPLIAESEQLIAIPMLIKSSPSPQKKLIGDMSNTDKILRALNLPSRQ
ncbi:circadian clock KaiB family protein [Mucilaginibacter xinganensis]|uniref:Circadian clock protein KaiB n=1 Tax=Mucilaginibacter xinganensis TaxID=1234841 RepID=A0A223P0H2_9SPHI|nr:circadian clock KaiB family protein [Mucilaginibacter xinganensis]ASU35623.1 Circadian clock protein KaiB [Mucilaginibacter xinganensis]